MNEGLEEGDELVDAAAALAGEGGNEDLLVIVVGNEEGVDEHGLMVNIRSQPKVAQQFFYFLIQGAKSLTFVSWRSACHDLARGCE